MSISLNSNLGIVGHHTKMKMEGVVSCYIGPLYGTILEIIFDKKTELCQKNFLDKYHISNEGLPPKNLKIGKELQEEVGALFGLIVIMAIHTLTTMMKH
jgi:hypothetical protein